MFELLFLLLPVAAVYGFFMGRHTARSQSQARSNRQQADYLRGVEYLLDHKQEQAVDKFIACLNADPSFESSLALGNLFRQRGELGKAISLHERMAGREHPEDGERELAQLELARDFISAGLLDRAEPILRQLAEIPRRRQAAAGLLLQVCEREQDYAQAVQVVLDCRESFGAAAGGMLGRYYCEQAEERLRAGDREAAAAAYRQALDVARDSLRARLGLAGLCLRERQYARAYDYVKQAVVAEPQSGLLCLDYVTRCFPNKADPAYRCALEDLVHRAHSAGAMAELVHTVEQISGGADAEALLLNFIQERPNLKLFSALIGLRLRHNPAAGDEAIARLKSLLDAQIASGARFACTHCGFESKIMFWQCPSCRTWDSFKTKIGLDGD